MQPKRQKYRKQFRGKIKGKAQVGATLSFGDFGLKSLGTGWVLSRQIESARKAIANYTKRQAKVWIRIFPDKPITKKPAGKRMGGGKGDIETYVAVVQPGRILFELVGVTEEIAFQALKRASAKLGIKTKFIKKD